MAILEVKDLNFSYEEEGKTIDNVSFSVEEGSYTTIVGHNGSGKSTIAKLIMGLLESASGTITIDGIALNNENLAKIRSRIGIVFQNPDNQFIGATVRDDIAFGLENHCVEPSMMDEIIDTNAALVKMSDFMDQEPTHLSGGQKHLLIFMYNNPSITVAIDELDFEIFEYLLGEILKIIAEKGQGQLIFTSHNLRPLETLDKSFIVFTTTNPNNRYIRLTNVKENNNLRSFYYRDIVLGGQDTYMDLHLHFGLLLTQLQACLTYSLNLCYTILHCCCLLKSDQNIDHPDKNNEMYFQCFHQ